MGLAASMAIREEALALVPLVAALVAFRERAWTRRAKVATLVALPGVFVFALWTLANWLIMGNPVFWYEQLKAQAVPPVNAPWLPAHKTLVSGIAYAASYSWAFVPTLLVVLPLLLIVVRSRRRRFWELATIAGGASVFPGQVAVLVYANKSWGDTRYLAALIIFGTVILGFAAREVARARGLGLLARRSIVAALVCCGALNAVSGTLNDLNPKRTQVEGESVAFRAAFGLPATSNTYQPPILAWRAFDRFIDPHLAEGQLIMVDTLAAFPAPLFSRYPKGWVIPSDVDFQKLAENFSGQFQWLLQTPSRIVSPTAGEIDEALSSTDGGHWRNVKNFGTIGELYRWVPDNRLAGHSV
jgi:hypothetical protein